MGRGLLKNTGWNVLGLSAPLLAAAFVIPVLIGRLGPDRFGVLALAWAVIGYFGLFDLGLGRALTKLVAERLGIGRATEIAGLVWTAFVLIGVLGLAGGVVLAAMSRWLVVDVMRVPIDLRAETVSSFYWLALSVPLVVSTACLRGVLEAYERFDLVNAVRIPTGLFTFVAPLGVLAFSAELPLIVSVLVGGRAAAWAAHLWLCLRTVPALRPLTIDRAMISPLLTFGGWMTISNVVGPIMVYFDRFLIGAAVSVTAVAYYVAPYEVASKLLLIPAALLGVLFPSMAASLADDGARAVRLLDRGLAYTVLVMFPIVLGGVTFAREGLELWLGRDFAAVSAPVARWLLIGVLVNAWAHAPFALVQGAGRADLTAKLHVFELPVFLVALWWSLRQHGLAGAAAVWALRAAVDAGLLAVIASRLVPAAQRTLLRSAGHLLVALPVLVAGASITALPVRGGLFGAATALFAVAAWFCLLDSGERCAVRRYVSRKAGRT